MSKQGYVLSVAAGSDYRVAGELAIRGYDALAPKTWTKKRVDGRLEALPRKRTPGYVFVAIDMARDDQDFEEVRQTLGVIDFLRYAKGDEWFPKSVPYDMFDGLRADENEDLDIATRRVRKGASPFTEGQKVVVIRADAFNGIEGTIKETRSGSVLVEIAGSKYPLRFREEEVVPADSNVLAMRREPKDRRDRREYKRNQMRERRAKSGS